ncbi:hypothetical protein [Pseudomonas sp. 2FG]|nr:hypothetical protein [Pseudomonas sp. 2FG]
MKTTAILGRSMLLVCLLGLLAACGSGEHEGQASSEGHGHVHD